MEQEEKIICTQCGKDLVMHILPVKEKDFCSSWCLEKYKRAKGDRKFFVEMREALKEMGERWIPKYADEYMRMCAGCKPEQMDNCHEMRDLAGSMINTLTETEEIHWCCHAHFNLSASLSDGTVPLENALKVQRYAEELTGKYKHKGVTPITLDIAFAELGQNYTYEKKSGTPPEINISEMSHAAACLLCNPEFGKQCEVQVEEEFRLVEKVRGRLKGLWCRHCIQALSHVLMNRSEEEGFKLLDQVIALAEKVAEERGHAGVVTPDLFVALGRTVS
jgi:hypothetical protein